VDADQVWGRIINHAGEVARLKGGREFTYDARGRTIHLHSVNQMISRAMISRAAIEKALHRVSLRNTSVVQDLPAPSYVYAILMDPRIRAGDW